MSNQRLLPCWLLSPTIHSTYGGQERQRSSTKGTSSDRKWPCQQIFSLNTFDATKRSNWHYSNSISNFHTGFLCCNYIFPMLHFSITVFHEIRNKITTPPPKLTCNLQASRFHHPKNLPSTIFNHNTNIMILLYLWNEWN